MREIGAADLDVGRDGVEVGVGVAVAVAAGDLRTEAADAEDGDDRGDVGHAEVVVVNGAVASAGFGVGVGVGIGREGDEEGVERPRVGGEDGRGDDGEEQEEAEGGHGGGCGEPDLWLWLGKGKVVASSEKMEIGWNGDPLLFSGSGDPAEWQPKRPH